MIRAEHVSVSFGPVVALDDVSFSLDAGTSLALVGPNGSGKTTLLNVLAGLTDPGGGRVERRGAGRPAVVLQHSGHGSWLPLTVAEVVQMGRFAERGLTGRLGPDDRRAIDEAADRLEVRDLFDRQFGELSGGQRQRALVAQALAQRPELLLMDEPITGLDLASQHRILDVMDEETAAGHVVVVSTHHLEEATRCDRVLLLDRRMIAEGPPEEVLTDVNLKEAYGGRVFSTDGHLTILDDHGHGIEGH